MKTIGFIGGMSWESTAKYYQIINEEVNKRLGGLHSAKCMLYSVDFAEIETLQSKGQWDLLAQKLSRIAKALEDAGADFIVICTNTIHKVVEKIEKEIHIPILHIADATARQIKRLDIKTVGLLGTAYTMEQDFYRSRLQSHDLHVLIPHSVDRQKMNQIIFEELCLGIMNPSSRDWFKHVIQRFVQQGAEGIILGCTELGLLIKKEDASVPLFDTTYIHALEAVHMALNEDF